MLKHLSALVLVVYGYDKRYVYSNETDFFSKISTTANIVKKLYYVKIIYTGIQIITKQRLYITTNNPPTSSIGYY